MRNHQKRIYSFLGSWPAIIPGDVISSCACIVLLSEASSSSHVIFNIAHQRGLNGPERSRGLVKLGALPLVEGGGVRSALLQVTWMTLGASKIMKICFFLKIDKEHPRAFIITPEHS